MKGKNMIPPTMVPPSQRRENAYLGGIIQVWITRACDQACFGCTQGSNYAGKPGMITIEQFEQAVVSLKDYWGVLGVFGGNPTMHPHFEELCKILQKHRSKNQCGLWCNNLRGQGSIARETFDPRISNLNVHLSKEAFDEFRKDWPESLPFGRETDSRHATPYVSMLDLGIPEEQRLDLIGRCDVNQNWSAMVCVFRGQLRGYFCEVAGAQAMLQQWDTHPSREYVRVTDGEYVIPDVGIKITGALGLSEDKPIVGGMRVNTDWWKLPMSEYGKQVDFHCHRCGIPLRGQGELAIGGETEFLSETYKDFRPKTKGRKVEIVTQLVQLNPQGQEVTKYLGK